MTSNDGVRSPLTLESAVGPEVLASPTAVRDKQHLTAVTHRALNIALSPAGRDGDGELEGVMQELCLAARRQGARAEELIILFKEVWSERPEVRGRSREEAARLFDHVVTMCIKEYYEEPR